MGITIGVVGYSAMKFDKTIALLLIQQGFDTATAMLKFPSDVKVASGLTNLGIPAIAYQEAVRRGWKTIGYACTDAENYECFPVNERHIIGDNWGDESNAFLDCLSVLIRVGGGKQSLREVELAKEWGMPVIEFELEAIAN
jgi:hypothetical protein